MVPLTESFNNGQKLSGEIYLFLERREIKYLIGIFNFLKRGDFLIVSFSLPSLLPPTLTCSAMFNSEFLANLIIDLIPIPISTFSAMSDGKFLADRVGYSEYWGQWSGKLTEILNETLIEIGQITSIFVFFIYCLLLNAFKIKALEGPVKQIPLFLTCNYYGR